MEKVYTACMMASSFDITCRFQSKSQTAVTWKYIKEALNKGANLSIELHLLSA